VLSFEGPGPATYAVTDGAADYGTLNAGTVLGCMGECYALQVSVPSTRPATHWDARLRERLPEVGDEHTWSLHIGDSFTDVTRASPFYAFIETLLHRGITGGCVPGSYCPRDPVTREQAAVFVLVGREWPGYAPPPCLGAARIFADVPANSPFCPSVEELARRGVVGGCGAGLFCPQAPVTRQQMPVFVLATLEGPSHAPPPCGVPRFADVSAASPFCPWIEELARRGVVSGCGGGNFCPTASVTRDQMAVFIGAGFGLTLYGP
jgi:hypothetical protein